MTDPATDSTEKKSSPVVIDLDDLGLTTTVKESTQLIQQSVFKSLELRISEDLKAAKSLLRDGELVPAGSGLTYFVDGTRGAGKSTFLQYAYQGLFREEKKKNIEESIKPLLFLDPSRIERSEMMLLHVLKHLKLLAKPKAIQGFEDDRKYREFHRLMEEMAGGLHLFVSDNSHLKDLDAELFLEQGLERAADSQKLRQKLHEAIDLVCEIQGADALLIAVDDADTDAKSAIETLECIRKYLDTPRLVILVTGDMEMYSLLVQNHFVSTFARSSDKLNEDRHRQQLRMVEHLEEQYLLKLFPLQRRAQLKTLWQITKGEKNKYQIKSDGEKSSLQEWVDRLAKNGLRVCSSTDKRLFTEFLLKQPVRSILQVLSIFTRAEKHSTSQINACSVALRSMALSSLYKYGVDVDEIAASELNALTEAVFDLSLRDGDPDTGVYLRPQSRDASLRNSFVALAADVARLCQGSLANSLTYTLVGPGSVSVYLQVARASKESSLDAKKNEALIRIFKQYFAVGRKEDALNWAWRTTASLPNASVTRKSIQQGVVGLRKRLDTGARDVHIMNTAIRKSIANPKVTNYPSHAFSLIDVTSSNDISLYSSIYNIMGLMARLLSLDVASNQLANDVNKLLSPLLAGLTISPPNWSGLNASESSKEAEENANDLDGDEPGFKNLEETANNIVDWLRYCATLQDKVTPSATFLGKVWTRLYFSLNRASEDIRSSSVKDVGNYSSIMEIYAWCVINAFLVEEIDHHVINGVSVDESINLNRKNPATSVKEAADKFSKVDGSRLPLTYTIASCPLILGLMNSNASYFDDFASKLCGDNESLKFVKKSSCDETTWDLMSQVMYAGKKSIEESEYKTKGSNKPKSSGSEGGVTESEAQ